MTQFHDLVIKNQLFACVRCLHSSSCLLGVRPLWQAKWLKEVYWRRTEAGPEAPVPRFDQQNWNYESEVFSFGQRLGEDFDEGILKRAFTDESFEYASQNGSNTELSSSGQEVSIAYIKAYLRHSFPALPEEGISAVSDHLMHDDMLSYIAANLGVPDLIRAEPWPYSNAVVAKSFKAVIGALCESQGAQKAELFVQDFILTQLVGRDLSEIWNVIDPMGVLHKCFQKMNKGELEPRLLWETGSQTVMSSYMVGLYTEDKALFSKGYGETVSIAEEMAARDGLSNLFGLRVKEKQLPFGEEGHKLDLDMAKRNSSLADIA